MRLKNRFFMALLGMIFSFIAVGCNDSNNDNNKGDDRSSYTITYYDEADNPLPDLTQEIVSGSEIILPSLSKAGFTFSGWQLDKAAVDGKKVTVEMDKTHDMKVGDKVKIENGGGMQMKGC